MNDEKKLKCPACGQQTLGSHCGEKHPTCTWHSCGNKSCDAQIDLALKIGHCIDVGGKRRRLTLGEPA